jgi:Type ISP C-terminal specificity domain/N-6 DNA Methylase
LALLRENSSESDVICAAGIAPLGARHNCEMPAPAHLDIFLSAIRAVHATQGGTKETSYYTALNNLFDSIGDALKPKVRAVMQLKNLDAGNPDGGFFTQDQFDRATKAIKNLGAPSRGVVEVKSPNEAIATTTESKQVDKYWKRYKLVLVTNLRDWKLIGERNGKPVKLESFQLAADEAKFWALAAHPQTAQKVQGQAFTDFLTRVLTHDAPLADPKDVAALLASYAREARHRVAHADDKANTQLKALQESLEAALGVKFQGEEGNDFFRSTLVQTLFYGLFAAWVLRHESGNDEAFDWKAAAHDLHVPMISALFEQIASPTKLKALNLTEVLDWTQDALNRVDKSAFFAKFQAAKSVQYFYEPFLEAFDPALRKRLGVWYTPEEIVRYQVARVDQVLQTELGIANGLADENVVVLDPCCGTGAYLVEVLRVIGEKLKAQGADALSAHELKKAATQRLFGFELLPAPYVVAHLQLGLLLKQLGTPLAEDERAGIYLTNALTGWDPLENPKAQLPFPEFQIERDAADAVKQTQKILVILGNPPYDGYASVAIEEERGLSNAYRASKRTVQPQGQGLNDLYVRFFRMAERQIAEKTQSGVICFISNYSWLDGLSHPAMRERFLEAFDTIRIDNLNGDKYRTGKLTPDGESDPSAFSTPSNREGIQVGTAIATLTRRAQGRAGAADGQVLLRQWWGKEKLAEIGAFAASLSDADTSSEPLPAAQISGNYAQIAPQASIGLAYFAAELNVDYPKWPRVTELFPENYSGCCTKRDEDTVSIDLSVLKEKIQIYFDTDVSDEEARKSVPSLMRDADTFQFKPTRAFLQGRRLLEMNFLRYQYRPFDRRWIYWEPETKLLGSKSPEFEQNVFVGNYWIFTTARTRKTQLEPCFVTPLLSDLNLQDSGSRGIPLRIREEDDLVGQALKQHGDTEIAFTERNNLSQAATEYLRRNLMEDEAETLFFHAIAILHAPAYRSENAGGLRQDWPRIPLPADANGLGASAALGREIAALLDTEKPVVGVTSGAIRPGLKTIAVISTTSGKPLSPSEFALTAGWGHGGNGKPTMPAKGKLESRAAIETEANAALGTETSTHDIYLNATAHWKNVPPLVWDYTIGGYQVIKKWLSYREERVLGRALSSDEIKEVTNMARRIAALILLNEKLDENYRAICVKTVRLN